MDKFQILSAIRLETDRRLAVIKRREKRAKRQHPPSQFYGHDQERGQSLTRPLGGGPQRNTTIGNANPQPGGYGRGGAGGFDPGIVVNIPNTVFRRKTERYPFFYAETQGDDVTVGGPFSAIAVNPPFTLGSFAVVQQKNDAKSFYMTGQRRSLYQYVYWDSNGNVTNQFTGKLQLPIYLGGGIWGPDIPSALQTFRVTAPVETVVGNVITTISQITGFDYQISTSHTDEFILLGEQVRVTQDSTNNPTQGSTTNKISEGSFTRDYNFIQNVGYERAEKTGLFSAFGPRVYASHEETSYERIFNRSNGNYTSDSSEVFSFSDNLIFNYPLFAGLEVERVKTDNRTKNFQENLTRTAGASLTQNDSRSLTDNSTTLDIRPQTFLAAADGSGCLYFIRKEIKTFSENNTGSVAGSVQGFTGTLYPEMNNPILFAAGNGAQITLTPSGPVQGADGGWFAGNIGILGPEDLPGLACPSSLTVRMRTDSTPVDLVYTEYDSAYGDNSSRIFPTRHPTGYAVFCGYGATIIPSTITGSGVLIDGVSIIEGTISPPYLNLLEYLHPDILDSNPTGTTFYYPGKSITRSVNNNRIDTETTVHEFYAFIPGIGSLRIPNAEAIPNQQRIHIEFLEQWLSPSDWNSLQTPSFTGPIEITDQGNEHFRHKDPVQTSKRKIETISETYTDNTSALATTSISTVLYEYESDRNPLLERLVGKTVFLLNRNTDPWIRFEGTVTAVSIDSEVDPNIDLPNSTDIGGNGLPGEKILKGLSINITGAERLKVNMDEYADANYVSSSNFLYFPYLENFQFHGNVNWPSQARSTLTFRSASEISSDPDQTTTLLGLIAIAGRQYRNGQPNCSEVYEIRRDPTLPSDINDRGFGQVTIKKRNKQNPTFTTINSPQFADSYSSVVLSQWPKNKN